MTQGTQAATMSAEKNSTTSSRNSSSSSTGTLKTETTYIKIYGLKRTGTNWIRYLLEKNFKNVRALMDVGGWKHGFPQLYPSWNWEDWYPEWKPDRCPVSPEELGKIRAAYENKKVKFVCMVRPLPEWIEAMCRYWGISVEDLPLWKIEVLSRQWNSIVSSYSTVTGAVVLFYDKFRETWEESLGLIGEKFAIEPRGNVFINIEKKFERGNDLLSPEACLVEELPYFHTHPEIGKLFSREKHEVMASCYDSRIISWFKEKPYV